MAAKMVDPANTPLGRMLVEEISPVVMVLATPLVEEACHKNSLSFVQLISPFCVFNNIDVPVRTASDQPYRLQKFKLRLFNAADIRTPNLEVAKARLKGVITHAGEKDFSDLSSEQPPVSNLLSSSKSAILPSWFQFFNKEIVRSMSFSDHEAFDHPVACFLVVSSKDEYPINRFIDLFNTNSLPSLLSDGVMDPKVLKHYLLLHDNQEGTTEKAMKILSEMRNTFGYECQLLCINSSKYDLAERQNNPWASYMPDVSPSHHLGRFLNKDDMDEIKDIMQNLSSKHIIPYMEQKIRILNQQIAATRKGFRNQIKNLWWRKGKEETPDATNGYTYSSVESQIRVLGDYAFMLRDYELALSNYRLISTDYKLDKAWKRYAGIQEMMGLTYFMLDQSRKDAEYCMETAFTTYTKLGSSDQKFAVRCGLWWVEMLKTRELYKEAASVYFRICGEDLLHSAVMLEQASYCYLFSKPSMLRKYGFHLVLSGDRYRRCDQIKHAIRTYRSAVSVFKGTMWSFIKDHVHFHIGQWYASLGMYDVAVAHMLQILSCSHQSKVTQELFLRDFLQIVQKTGKVFDASKLQLPIINLSSLKVLFEDHRTYGSPSATSIKERFWSSLEEDMVPSLPTVRTNWLELQSRFIPKKLKDSNVCVAGEAIKVDVEFRNPLHISISITGVSLICEHSARSDETKSGAADRSDTKLETNEQIETTSRDDVSEVSAFTSSAVDFSLGSGEKNVVQLTVTPSVEGALKVVGVRWKLSGSVVGFYNFEDHLPKRKVLRRRTKAKPSPGDNLKFVVIKNLPKLQGFIRPLPKMAYAGELQQLVLELRNQSELPVKNLKMKISHPRFLNIGTQDSLNMGFPACLEKKIDSERSDLNANPSKTSRALFIFPEDTSCQGESPLLWPLWLRAATPGNVSLYIAIYYEMTDTSSTMNYRILRLHYNLQVLPSLDVSIRINPCPSRLKQFLVRMDVVNKTSSESFQVDQLSSVGPQWEISLLQPVDSTFPSRSLASGQALSCFFMLKDCRKSPEDNNSALHGSDVRLCPQSSSEPVFDISSSPLAIFHHYENLQEETPHQAVQNTVDFILISRLLKSNSTLGVSDSPTLFSHHACHCSTASTSPISWLIDGPRIIHHNFSSCMREVRLRMTIYNSSDAIVSVHIDTSYTRLSGNSSSQLSNAAAAAAVRSGNQSGWHDASIESGVKITSDGAAESHVTRTSSPESISSFIWTGSSSTRVSLEPMSSLEIPLQVCVFSPGAYDLSNYALHWNVLGNVDKKGVEVTKQTSGTCLGYTYCLMVLQST